MAVYIKEWLYNDQMAGNLAWISYTACWLDLCFIWFMISDFCRRQNVVKIPGKSNFLVITQSQRYLITWNLPPDLLNRKMLGVY